MNTQVELILDALWELGRKHCPRCEQELEPQVTEQDIKTGWLRDPQN